MNSVQGDTYVSSPFCEPVGIIPGGDIKMKTTLGLPSQVSQQGYGPAPFYSFTFV